MGLQGGSVRSCRGRAGSTEDYESELGLGFTVQGLYEVGSSFQMEPTVESERLGQFGEPGVST